MAVISTPDLCRTGADRKSRSGLHFWKYWVQCPAGYPDHSLVIKNGLSCGEGERSTLSIPSFSGQPRTKFRRVKLRLYNFHVSGRVVLTTSFSYSLTHQLMWCELKTTTSTTGRLANYPDSSCQRHQAQEPRHRLTDSFPSLSHSLSLTHTLSLSLMISRHTFTCRQ